MTIHKNERKETGFEVYSNLFKLRKEIIKLASYNFYAKQTANKGETQEQCMQRFAFEQLRIRDAQKKILDLTDQLAILVLSANKIYPTYVCEYEERRLLQDLAVAKVYSIIDFLQWVIEDVRGDIKCFVPLESLLESEVKLIRKWRQSDNKFVKGLKKL